MNWLLDNWVWVLLIGGFIGLHLFGHRFGMGCGGHSNHQHHDTKSKEGRRHHAHHNEQTSNEPAKVMLEASRKKRQH